MYKWYTSLNNDEEQYDEKTAIFEDVVSIMTKIKFKKDIDGVDRLIAMNVLDDMSEKKDSSLSGSDSYFALSYWPRSWEIC